MKRKKEFDCVQMKRRIQEKIYGQTKDLSREELVAYCPPPCRDRAVRRPVEEAAEEDPLQNQANEALNG